MYHNTSPKYNLNILFGKRFGTLA